MAVEKKSDRWISITQSVLLHGLVVGALAYGVYAYKKMPRTPTPTLAIEASVVESKDATPPAKADAPPTPPPPAPEPEPSPPEPVDQGPPSPTPEEREQQEREAAEAVKKLDEDRAAQDRKVAEEKAAAEKAAEQKVREEVERKKREAEEKKLADAKKAAEAKRKAEEQKQAAQREAELRKSLEAEEHAAQLRSSGALASWLAQIANRIQRAWLRPPSAKPGIDCMVYVTQVPGGEVTNVRVGECNGDAAVRQSIESAVLRASPLPPPPDPSLFDRNLEIRFVPAD